MQHPAVDCTGANRGTFKSYTIGFLCSVVLTAVAYLLAMSGVLSRSAALGSIIVLAVAQILVHLHYFLHLDSSSAARWNVLVMVFTLLIMLIFVGGTLWIMYYLNYRMM